MSETSIHREAIGRPKIFYGWLVVAAGFAVMTTLGETFYAFGVFFKPLENEFGWSRSLTSSVFTIFIVGYAISVTVTGRLADRHKPRFILLCSGLLAGLGLSLASLVSDINQLRLFLFMAGLGSGATLSIPISSVQRWFYNRPHAATALALVMTGAGVGGVAFAPLLNHLIVTQGWRNAYLIAGVIFAAILIIASFIIKRSPLETTGILLNKKDEVMPKAVSPGWTTRRALASPAFIALLFIALSITIAFQILTVHLVPHATDLGMSATAAAAALGLIGGFSTPARIASGFISNRIGWKRMMALACFGGSLSVIWLLFLKDTWMLYGIVLIFGISLGVKAVAGFGIIGEFFGMRSVGELIGINDAVANVFSAVSPYMAGVIFDTTGSYSIAFIIAAIFLLAGGALALAIKKPAAGPG